MKIATFDTSKGKIRLELHGDKTPKTVTPILRSLSARVFITG